MIVLAPAVATVLVALIGLVGVRMETARRASTSEHDQTTLLLRTLTRDVGGLRADIRDLTNRFNDHVDE